MRKAKSKKTLRDLLYTDPIRKPENLKVHSKIFLAKVMFTKILIKTSK